MPDMWETTAGGVMPSPFTGTPTTTRQYNRQQSAAELMRLGTSGYVEAHPEIFDSFAGGWFTTGSCSPYVNSLRAQSRELGELASQFTGPESTFIRWLIEDKQRKIANEIDKEIAGTRAGLTLRKPEPLPVPSWMQEYIEPSMPLERSQYPYTGEPGEERRETGRFAKEGKPKAAALIPMGAQAELSPEQMGLMAGYQAWGMAGSPYSYSEEAITRMADWRRWWEPYTRLSESLFPQRTKLGKGWMPAKQR